MFVTLDDMKNYLGIPLVDTDYDAFLTQQITLMSDTIDSYCGRKFEAATYTQTYYVDEANRDTLQALELYHYPVNSVTSVVDTTNTYTYLTTDYRLVPTKWNLKRLDNRHWFDDSSEELTVIYEAGYTTIPTPVTSVVYDLVEERYNKKSSGMSINFGKDVQRVSIPGAIAVDYDYTLTANERTSKYGMILGNYANVLDPYRSEKVMIGSSEVAYV